MARRFNGTSDKILVPSSTKFNLTEFSIGFSINSDAPSTSVKTVIDRSDANGWAVNTSQGADGLASSQADLRFWVNIAGTWRQIGVANVIVADRWLRIMATYSQTVGLLEVYRDGIFLVRGAFAGAHNIATTQSISMGAGAGGTASFFGGRIAGSVFYGRALSPSEIEKDHREGFQPVHILAGRWPIYGQDSPEPDLSGNGNGGVVTGTTRAAHPNVIKEVDIGDALRSATEITRGWCRN